MSDRPICRIEGCKTPAQNHQVVNGVQKYKIRCASHHKKKYGMSNATFKRRRNLSFKGEICDSCGFVPMHSCQLDLDHIDGNGDNYNADNLQTLCANCHRLKTYLNKDWEPVLNLN